MEDGFWFKSDLFQIRKGEDEETNPGCYGRELGNWLCEKFRALGYDVEALIAEDWGWCVMCRRQGYLLWVGCGAMTTSDFPDNYDPRLPPDGKDVIWYAFPVVEVPFFYFKSWLKKLMGRLDLKAPLKKINHELKQLLEKESRIEFCERP